MMCRAWLACLLASAVWAVPSADGQIDPVRPSPTQHVEPGPREIAPGRYVVIDDLRREVEVAVPASRVAAFSPFAVDALLDLELPPILRPTLPGPSPSRWDEVPSVAFDHTAGPTLEPIVAAQPDLILLPSVYAGFIEPLTRATGAPVLALDILSVEDLHRHVRTLGVLTDRASRAEEWVGGRRAALASLANGERDPSPRVFAMFGTSHAFYGFTGGSYLGDLIGRMGGSLVAPSAAENPRFRGLSTISMEELVATDPDVIVLVRHATARESDAGLAGHAAWQSIRAVREGRVITLPDLLFVTCPGSEPDAAAERVREIVRGGPGAAASATPGP